MSKVGGFEVVVDDHPAPSEWARLSESLLSWSIVEGWTWYEGLTSFLFVSWLFALLCGLYALIKVILGRKTFAKKLE